MELSINDIVKSINGLSHGQPNASLALAISFLNKDGTLNKDGANYASYKPEITLTRLNKYAQVELKFRSYFDSDIEILWKILENYGELMRGNKEDGLQPFCSLTLVPNAYECEYFAVASNPIFWAINHEPEAPDVAIRLCFDADDVLFYQTDIDKEMLDKEIKREMGMSFDDM